MLLTSLATPLLPRFTLLFDREGYSPELFAWLWSVHRIAILCLWDGPLEPNIVAINTDKDAPISEVADVLVVADVMPVVATLNDRLRNDRRTAQALIFFISGS